MEGSLPLPADLVWWITLVEIPALAGLLGLLLKSRRDADMAVKELADRLQIAAAQLRQGLDAFKLEVARTYASTAALKETETRLTERLMRIETKLDRVAETKETSQ